MLFNRLFETRNISFQSIFEAGDDVALGTLSAVNIDDRTVLQVNAVFSAVSLIADTVSTLPIGVFVTDGDTRVPYTPKPAWVDKPDIDLPREAFYNSLLVSLLLDGNAFVRVFSSRRGEVVNLTVLNPLQVEVVRNGVGRIQFKVEGESKVLTTEDIVFIPDLVRPGHLRGESRVKALKENFGLALALEKFASNFFGAGTNLSGVIEFPGSLTAEQAANLANGFDNRHKGWRRGHRTGILSGGATFKATQIDPAASQSIEARHMAVEDVARAFNVPPHLLALPGTNSFASVEQNNLAWVTHGLRPLVTKIEGAMTPLLSRSPGGDKARLRFNLDGLLRADITSRTSAYSQMITMGAMTINDVRRLEDLPPMPEDIANKVRVPLSNVNIDDSAVSATGVKVAAANQLVIAGYNPAEVLAALGLPPIGHSGLASVQLQADEDKPVTDVTGDE